MKSIGIDIGKRRCIVCIMDRNGTVLEETGYENTYAAADAFARKARREYGKCQAVCESTGNLWIKTYEAFEDRGIPIELANPMKVRAIAEASVKTDKVDARTLAHLLRTNLIARCHVAERGVGGVRQLLRERNNLVKARTQAINRLHNLLDRYDLNPKDFAQDIWREKALKALDSKSLADPNDDYVLHRYVRGIRHHNAELSLLEKKIAGHASASEDARILMSMNIHKDPVLRLLESTQLRAWLCPTDIYSPKIARHNDPMIAARPNEKRKTRSATIRPGPAASAGPHTEHDTEDSRGSGRPIPGQARTGRHDRLPAKGHGRRLHSHGSRGAHLPKDGGPPQDEPGPRHEDRAAQDTLKEHHMARLRHDPRAIPA